MIHLGKPSSKSASGDPEDVAHLPDTVALVEQGKGWPKVHLDPRTAAVRPVALRSSDSSKDTFTDEFPLVGGEGSHQAQHQSAGRRGRVDASITDGDEADPEVSKLVEELEKVLKAPAKPVEFPHGHQIHLAELVRRVPSEYM